MSNFEFNFENKLNKSNVLIFALFGLYFFIGCLIFKDYSISLDEPINRINGLVTLHYIVNKFSIPLDLSNVGVSIPSFESYSSNINIVYGVIFDLPLAFIEVFFDINDTRNIYLVRHFFTFLIFFLSTICFYNLIIFHYKKNFLALLGVLILILSPRIFAESFYNGKDIVFLSLVIFSTFYNLKALNKGDTKSIFLASFFSALATSLRVLGIYIPLLTFLFYYLNYKEKTGFYSLKKFSFYYLISFFIFLYLLWPYLWENPFQNFLHSFTQLSNLSYTFYTLYMGEFINTKYLPWHYFFVWFCISTPPVFLFLIIYSSFYIIIDRLKNFFTNVGGKTILLWKNNHEMNEIFIFSIFIIPVLLTIFINSTLYNGWRHFYFVYPSLVFLCIKTIDILPISFNRFFRKSIIFLLFIQLGFAIDFIIRTHPVQSVYFNDLSKKIVIDRFVYDYWGVGNQISIEKLINDESYTKPVKVATASFTDLNNTKLFIKSKTRKDFLFLGTDKHDADYIFTNYYYNEPPNSKKKFKIPDNFESIIRLEVDGLLINEIFQKK